ncbi:brain-specific angiogenesis inhibitor 1-associated protein 2-like protein 2 [Acyrthosiphon pisum]|uniref:Brain-specific angiogenesis inhibitor 1-associated protein 2 n=1 Tax=Acyrthosiphon pisum TaxID=7029 RepID=A0A8R2NMZ3_ACYPI|nr:brain-specific angiogenesis inhibitor 1-associated protein 2-like protein 2 [Acyrthosiphon pisum]
METEEITKLVDGIYKNILEKFNPGARQMINAGKAYLKALQGAASASKLYTDAIMRLAKQSQQGTWGGSADIGSALMQIVEVYKEIQSQQLNILKAFYVDLLLPLETNLEKDTKVVQSEQKRFLQQHKQRSESYSKAASAMKKCRKKHKVGPKAGLAMDKEIKTMQILEEEKSKLDNFCEQSLKNAMTQERRRYGFVLERQCSLVKHCLAYHTNTQSMYDEHLNDWLDVAKSRERLPESVETMFATKLRQVSFWLDDDVSSPRIDDDRISMSSQLRKTKSMDASCLDVRAMNDISSPVLNYPLSRAKSDFNLNASSQSLNRMENGSSPGNNGSRPKSMAVVDNGWESQGANLVQATHAYLSSGENQLSFHEGDTIAISGERNKGWQFGENLRTQCSGWFPLTYTEPVMEDSVFSDSPSSYRRKDSMGQSTVSNHNRSESATIGKQNRYQTTTLTRFGDSLSHRNPYPARSRANSRSNGYGINSHGPPPPSVPAPVVPRQYGGHIPPPVAFFPPPPQTLPPAPGKPIAIDKRTGGVHHQHGNASLHSSNDSGFSNDPPPAPEIDYSDDENARTIKDPKKDARSKQAASYSRSPEEDRGYHRPGHHHSQTLTMTMGGRQSTGTMKSSYNGGGQGMNTGRRNTGTSSMRQSTSVGHLSSFGGDGNSLSRQVNSAYDNEDDDGGTMQGKKIKRTKSMWKFKKSGSSDEVLLTGMSMWKHRSLVDVNAADAEDQQQLQHNNSYNNKSSAGTPVANKKFTVASRDIDIAADDDDSQTIMNGGVGGGSSTVRRMTYDNRKQQPQQQQQQPLQQHRSRRSSSSSFGGGDDSESCIVVDDHLKDVRSAPPAPASLLPRTRLIKQTAGKDGQGNGGMQPPSAAAHQHHHKHHHNQQPATMMMMMPPPPPPPPAVRTATADDGYAQHDSDADVRFESSKLQTFKYINATHNDGWYDSWGEKRKK